MADRLPVWIVEPDPVDKWNHWSKKFNQSINNPDTVQESIDIDVIKQQLKEIRQHSKDSNKQLVKELQSSISQRYPGIEIWMASDSSEAINHIKNIAAELKNISVNNSRSVTQELKPGLISDGFTIIDSYYDEIDAEEIKGVGYYEMPGLLADNLTGSFDVSIKLAGIKPVSNNGTKEYVAVLGVNAASADDGTILFLEHFRNIYKDLVSARKIILVIGLDKVVQNRNDAVFQTKCMGIFGAEGLLLDIHPKHEETPRVSDLPDYAGDDRELHVIFLDNSRTDLLDSEYSDYFMCIGCRACTGSCPAKLSNKPLSPKLLIFKLKKYLSQVSPELLQGKAEKFPFEGEERSPDEPISEDEIWACTTCKACQNVCPLELEHTKAIVDLRRNLVMISTSQAAREPLRNIRQRGHPWTGTVFSREDWIEGLGVKILAEDNKVEVLYWVGCTEALEDRSIKVAKAMGKLMNAAGESYGILGEEESCCGDPARRLGNERQFQLQVQKNIKKMEEYGVKKVVTACPHCYNTIKNEYPQFGGKFEVVHHTEYIGELIREGKLKVEGGERELVTYQDPCYLGRYNGIYGEPREILKGVPGMKLVEMAMNREESFCCGGGGGRMWLEENIGERISEMRVERVIETEAGVVATACPFCLQMFEDAVKVKGEEERLKVKDIAEILADKLT